MDDEHLEKTIGALKAQKRRQVVELLLENPQGLRFNEISRALSIYPSTLEKHLAKLVESLVISHHDGRYLATVNSIHISDAIKNLQRNGFIYYLSSHILLLDNHELRARFGSLIFEVIPDLISIINQIKSDFDETQVLIQAGGNLDYQIGKSIYQSGMLNHEKIQVELILTHELIDLIRSHGEENLFMNQFNDKTTRLYEIQECSLGIGVGESSGFLFLPRLDFEVDYHQCLYTRSSSSIAWLRDVFGYLKAQSQVFVP